MAPQRWKYPRTAHLPWSPGVSADDRVAADTSALTGVDVVVTLKYDGENTTIYPDGYCHARSLDSGAHPSRSWVRAFAAQVGPQLGAGMRLCGENVYAVHSIAYTDLPAHFVAYSVWQDEQCLSWADTLEWCELLGVVPVRSVFTGVWPGEAVLEAAFAPFAADHEGYVVRPAAAFSRAEFSRVVLKRVRAHHVQTDSHWLAGPVRVNGVAR